MREKMFDFFWTTFDFSFFEEPWGRYLGCASTIAIVNDGVRQNGNRSAGSDSRYNFVKTLHIRLRIEECKDK